MCSSPFTRTRTRTRTRACTFTTSALALILALALAVTLSGCFGIPKDPDVAATVNGQAILESEVTEYIEGFRSKNAEYETDTGWAEFLRDCGYTAETMRTYVLESVFIPRQLIREECSARNITLTDSEIDAVIEQERQYYEERYGSGSWDSVLASYGYDEDSWRENETDRLLEERLAEQVVGDVEVSTSQVQAQANEAAHEYNGKHSLYISFTDEEQANLALEALRAMGDAITAEQFASVGVVPQDGGWNSISEDRKALAKEYVNALNDLLVGNYSDVIELDGVYTIVYCDDSYTTTSAGEYTDLDSMPEVILGQVQSDAQEAVAQDEFTTWMQQEQDKAEITVNAMPSDLPYDVNVAVESADDDA